MRWVADVFLSYARPEAATAERIARGLAKAGWTTWYDREIPAHQPYADVIAAELEQASAVLVLWSAASAASEWVRSEANRARELHKLVQVRLDDARLPMPFDQIQCADLRTWRAGKRHTGWSQVCKSIHALTGPGKDVPLGGVHTDGRTNRRGLLIGGVAVASAAVAGGAWFWPKAPADEQLSPDAALLFQKGTDSLQNNDVFAAENAGSLANAIALLSEATEAAPRSASAWGALALAYAALKRVSPVSRRPGLDARSRSAAATALKLKPHEPRATAALLALDPLYRHWRSAEQADRAAIAHSPPIPLLYFLLSETLGSVGRWTDAATVSIKADRTHFIIPGADRRVVVDLWSAGDLQGADEALELAVEHWPQQLQVWRTRLDYLMYSGRPSDALAILHNDAQRPPGVLDAQVHAIDATANALGGNGDRADAVRWNLDYLRAEPNAVYQVVHACAALDDVAAAFSVLDGYYFNEGDWSTTAPAAGDPDRQTSFLFMPPMKTAWSDPRFAQLLRRVGLEEYWRQSGTVPDFRRNK